MENSLFIHRTIVFCDEFGKQRLINVRMVIWSRGAQRCKPSRRILINYLSSVIFSKGTFYDVKVSAVELSRAFPMVCLLAKRIIGSIVSVNRAL